VTGERKGQGRVDAVVGNAANSVTQGVWQYNDNVGSGWVSIGVI